jgi:hypothetical protein
MNEKKLFKLIAALIIIILGVILYVIVARPAHKVAAPSEGPITISGEVACLPKSGSGPHTLECAIGVKSSSNKYYGLKNLEKHDPEHKFSSTGQHVEVKGTFLPDEDNKYDTAGTIDITSIKEE